MALPAPHGAQQALRGQADRLPDAPQHLAQQSRAEETEYKAQTLQAGAGQVMVVLPLAPVQRAAVYSVLPASGPGGGGTNVIVQVMQSPRACSASARLLFHSPPEAVQLARHQEPASWASAFSFTCQSPQSKLEPRVKLMGLGCAGGRPDIAGKLHLLRWVPGRVGASQGAEQLGSQLQRARLELHRARGLCATGACHVCVHPLAGAIVDCGTWISCLSMQQPCVL